MVKLAGEALPAKPVMRVERAPGADLVRNERSGNRFGSDRELSVKVVAP